MRAIFNGLGTDNSEVIAFDKLKEGLNKYESLEDSEIQQLMDAVSSFDFQAVNVSNNTKMFIEYKNKYLISSKYCRLILTAMAQWSS